MKSRREEEEEEEEEEDSSAWSLSLPVYLKKCIISTYYTQIIKTLLVSPNFARHIAQKARASPPPEFESIRAANLRQSSPSPQPFTPSQYWNDADIDFESDGEFAQIAREASQIIADLGGINVDHSGPASSVNAWIYAIPAAGITTSRQKHSFRTVESGDTPTRDANESVAKHHIISSIIAGASRIMFPQQLPGSSLNDPYALDENEHQPGTSPLTLRVREWREEHPTEADIKDELSKLHRDNDGPKLHTILIMTAKHFDNSTRALLSSHHFDIRTDAEGVCVASRSTEWLTKTFPRQHARSERESDEYTLIAESRGYHRLPLSAFTRNAYEFENDDVWKSALRKELTKSTHVATCSSVALEVMLHFAAFATESLPGATKTAYSINRDNANIQELLAGPWNPTFDVTASARNEADPIEIFGQTESILTHSRKIQGKTFIANPEAKDVEVVLIACIKAVAEDPLTKGTIFIPSMPGCKTWRQYISNEGATLCPNTTLNCKTLTFAKWFVKSARDVVVHNASQKSAGVRKYDTVAFRVGALLPPQHTDDDQTETIGRI
jgi:hypothetical protein